MKLAILIGASKDTLESPLIPLAKGSHRFHVQGLHDSKYHIVDEAGRIELFNSKTITKGDRNIKLRQVTKGTEANGSICIFAELIPENEGDDGTIIT